MRRSHVARPLVTFRARSRIAAALALVAVAHLCAGCMALHRAEVRRRSEMAQIELARVAKDWSQTIRASQVIPVYPLSEDVQPGDVYLVTSTVEKQHEEYARNGYLALSNHVARVDPEGYTAFYSQSFAARDLPKSWLKPGEPKSFASAPAAAFPTYSFTVKSGQAFSGALPIQGVPVGLSLLGASEATGSVTIADARTYGVDMISLHRQIAAWARANADFLTPYASEGKKERYLRVVTRVYLAGRLEVSLNAASSSSAGLDVGVPKPTEIPALSVGTAEAGGVTAANYAAALESLNASLAVDAAPGASLAITAASSNSVSLTETFPRPVVIGYLGFDVRIGPGGALGPPMPTHAVLEARERPEAAVAAVGAETSGLANDYRILAQRARDEGDAGGPNRAIVAQLDELGERLLPLKRPVPIRDDRLEIQQAEGSDVARGSSAYRALITYLDTLRRTEANLAAHLNDDEDAKSERRAELARVQAEISGIEQRLFVTHGPLLKRADELASRE